jgi:hypothetical protein
MAFVVAIIVLVLGAAAPPIESQGYLPHVTVTLTEPAPVSVGPVDYEHVQVEGEVAYGNLPKNTVIDLTATTDNYWNVTISPAQVTVTGSFPASGSFRVNMDVRVPPKASADRPGVLTVEAIATTPPPLSINTSNLASTNIRVKQYYGLRLDTNHTVAVDQGRAVTNRFRVTNNGNGVDNFTIALTNTAEENAKGLTFHFDSAVLALGQDRALAVRVDINASKNATVSTSNAVFRVTSQGDPTQTDTFTLTIIVRENTDTDGGGDGNGTGGKKKSPGPAAMTSLAALVVVALALVAARRRRRA